MEIQDEHLVADIQVEILMVVQVVILMAGVAVMMMLHHPTRNR